jgi:hypothetical protein
MIQTKQSGIKRPSSDDLEEQPAAKRPKLESTGVETSKVESSALETVDDTVEEARWSSDMTQEQELSVVP